MGDKKPVWDELDADGRADGFWLVWFGPGLWKEADVRCRIGALVVS